MMFDEPALRYDGQWTLNGVFDHSVAGSVRLEQGVTLTLHTGELDNRKVARMFELDNIIATCEGHESVTLLGGFLRKCSSDTCEFSFSIAVIGRAIADESEVVFDACTVSLEFSEDWTNRRSVKRLPAEADGKSGVLFVEPANLTANVNDGSVTLGMRWSKTIGHQRVKFESAEVFHIKLPEAVTLDSLLRDWVKPLRYLLALATGVLPNIRSFEVGTIKAVKGATRELPAVVVFAYDRMHEQEVRRVMTHEMLFALDDIQYEVDIPKWFTLVGDHEAACDLIFSRSNRDSLTSRFFNVASAAEALHRRVYPGSAKRTDDDTARMRRILSSVDATDRDWVASKLGRAHEPSYPQRLSKLLEHAGSGAGVMTMSNDLGGPKVFCGAVAEYRNSIAHADRMDNVAIRKMWCLDLTLNALLRLVLLRELGWSEERCHSATMRHNVSWIN